MKKLVYFLYNKYFQFYFKIKFHKQINTRDKEIYIFDIDNTVANTWPSFLQEYKTLEDRLSSLAVFYNMRNYILNIKYSGSKVFFLTARPYSTYNLTFKWLNDMGLIETKKFLFLVSKPYDKVKMLKQVKNKKIFFYDDMTYNHEQGEIKYYKNEIKQLKKIQNIEYFDVKFINKIIGGYNE